MRREEDITFSLLLLLINVVRSNVIVSYVYSVLHSPIESQVMLPLLHCKSIAVKTMCLRKMICDGEPKQWIQLCAYIVIGACRILMTTVCDIMRVYFPFETYKT